MKKVISLALVLVLVLTAFAACTPVEEKILGSWNVNADLGAGFSKGMTYIFKEGGTGEIQVVGNLVAPSFRWSIYEKQLTIEMDASASNGLLQGIFSSLADLGIDPISYTFELKGDTLTLTTADGKTTTLTRVVTE